MNLPQTLGRAIITRDRLPVSNRTASRRYFVSTVELPELSDVGSLAIVKEYP